MKQDIHPDYTKATVVCNGCGNKFETKATKSKIEVEICANCHPFYTGKQKLVDVAGRVDKFRARQAAAQAAKPQKTEPKSSQKTTDKAAAPNQEVKTEPATNKETAPSEE